MAARDAELVSDTRPQTACLLTSAEWKSVAPPSDAAAIENLCADRELVTDEVVVDNAYYGTADIVKRWAGTPRDRPLMIALPHGAEYDAIRFFTPYELVPVVATCRARWSPCYATTPVGRLWHIASPYVHVVAIAGGQDMVDRNGSIYFPTHSTSEVIIDHDADEAIERLRQLPDCYHPVTVCIYWADVLRGIHRSYLKAGFAVASAGHSWDPLFLYRLHRICLRHRFALHHHLGSAIAFSIKSGCQVASIERVPSIQAKPMRATGEYEVTGLSTRETHEPDRSSHLLGELARMRHADQLVWADDILGSAFLRSPAETAAMIRRAERLDRWGVIAERGSSARRNPFTIPTMYRRAARRVTPDSVQQLLHPAIARLRAYRLR